MTFFSFATVKVVLQNLGFEITKSDPHYNLIWFVHPVEHTSTLIGLENRLASGYMKMKMDEIHLPFEYFQSLTITMRNLKKKMPTK